MQAFGALSVLFPGRMKRIGASATSVLRVGPGLIYTSAVINLLSLAQPLSILIVYDRIVPNQAYESLTALLILLIGVAAAEAILRSCRAYVLGWSAAKFELQTTLDGLDRLLTMDYQELTSVPANQQSQRLNAISRFADFMGSQQRLAMVDLPYVVLFLGIMWLIGGILAIVPIVMIGVFATAVWLLAGRFRNMLEARGSQDAKIYDFIQEVLSSALTVKGLSMESQFLRRFERLQRGAAETDFRSIEAAAHSSTLMSLFGNATIVAMVSTGGFLAAVGDLTVGTLAACTLLAGRTVQPVLRVAGIWTELQRAVFALNEFSQLNFGDKSDEELRFAQMVEPTATETAAYVRLKDVEIRAGDRLLVTNAHLQAPPGSIVVVTGQDGSGKSTLLRTISGEIKPAAGSVTIDGEPICSGAFGSLQGIAFAGAEQGLFNGSILDNLTLFGDGGTMEDALEAADCIGLTREILALPLGFDTPVGDGRTALASGLIQRIIIARAVAMRPRLLILDNPQSFLDHESDAKLLEGLKVLRERMTIVLCTGRPSYLRIADRVFTLKNQKLTVSTSLVDNQQRLLRKGVA